MNVWYYENAACVARDICRIPVKPLTGIRFEDDVHLSLSYDGLRCFYPIDIYPHNISSHEGLIESVGKCQSIDGFGLVGTARDNKYSILLSDIAIYWQLFRVMYSFSGLAPIRHDLFSVLGLWHTYQHAHKLLWAEFRSTFLAAAFFSLWPGETLLMEPKLKQSSTFLSWLRIAYDQIRPRLLESHQKAKLDLLLYHVEFIQSIRSGVFDRYDERYESILMSTNIVCQVS